MSYQNESTQSVKVWDPLVRVFHWSLVFFFLLAFITEDDWLSVHVQAGYAVSMLVGFRLFWGLVGTRYARFLTFVKSPSTVISHLKGMLSFNAPHYLGHNPVAAVMVIALLISIAMTAFTGMVTIASEGQGPLAATFLANWNGEWMGEIHEFFANFTLLLVFTHIAGVVFSSFLEGENLAKAMVTGRKKYREHWQDVNDQQFGEHTK
jgi:cytochrome b